MLVDLSWRVFARDGPDADLDREISDLLNKFFDTWLRNELFLSEAVHKAIEEARDAIGEVNSDTFRSTVVDPMQWSLIKRNMRGKVHRVRDAMREEMQRGGYTGSTSLSAVLAKGVKQDSTA